MKGGKTPLKPQGYTILEVMIVLAVSGMMFVIAASFINGKQAKTSFSTGVNDMKTQLQDVIDEVNDGKFSDKKISCTDSGSANLTINSDSTNGGQGVSPDCVFLGKLFTSPVAGDRTKYQIISLAGLRNATGLNTAKVTPVVGEESVDLTIESQVPQSLEIASIKINNSTVTNNVGLTQSYGESDGDNGYVSAVQNVNLVYGDNSFQNIAIANSAVICLTDGTRYATITLGEKNNQLTAQTNLGLANCP